MKGKKWIITGIVLFIIAAFICSYFSRHNNKGITTFETALVERGTVSTSITATGTVEPVKQVNIGTQVSGVIRKIYVDFNSNVREGQILAELDKKPLQEALTAAQANLEQANSQFDFQESNYNRIKQMYDSSAISETNYENALYLYQVAKASVMTAKSGVEKAETNLAFATIYSPINGVVLDRAVNEGQTVAASFNTPTLFTIAQDLTKMQVEADVDEADIGQVQDGQNVTFTVDAYPDLVFSGTVIQIRLKPTINANVVTYTVIVNAPNPDLKLKPGMTASIIDYTAVAKDVLYIPAKALRFHPDSLTLSRYLVSSERERKKGLGRGVRFREMTVDSVARARIWLQVGDSIRQAMIIAGLNNDIDVEVKEGLKPDDRVILSIQRTDVNRVASNEGITNPFMPRRPRNQGRAR
jgi:HlyD family secretion protein